MSYLENRTLKWVPSTGRSLIAVVTSLGDVLRATTVSIIQQRSSKLSIKLRAEDSADDTYLACVGDNANNFKIKKSRFGKCAQYNELRPNRLTLNITKPEFVVFGSRQWLSVFTKSLTTAIKYFSVSQVTTAKSLGATIDDKLDCGSHIVKRIWYLVPQTTSYETYQTLLQPHLEYCSIVVETVG